MDEKEFTFSKRKEIDFIEVRNELLHKGPPHGVEKRRSNDDINSGASR